jgi:hypothetical protein
MARDGKSRHVSVAFMPWGFGSILTSKQYGSRTTFSYFSPHTPATNGDSVDDELVGHSQERMGLDCLRCPSRGLVAQCIEPGRLRTDVNSNHYHVGYPEA